MKIKVDGYRVINISVKDIDGIIKDSIRFDEQKKYHETKIVALMKGLEVWFDIAKEEGESGRVKKSRLLGKSKHEQGNPAVSDPVAAHPYYCKCLGSAQVQDTSGNYCLTCGRQIKQRNVQW